MDFSRCCSSHIGKGDVSFWFDNWNPNFCYESLADGHEDDKLPDFWNENIGISMISFLLSAMSYLSIRLSQLPNSQWRKTSCSGTSLQMGNSLFVLLGILFVGRAFLSGFSNHLGLFDAYSI